MLYRIFNYLQRAWNKLVISPIKKGSIGKSGRNVKLGRGLRLYGPENLNLGGQYRNRRECYIYVY